MQWGGDAYEFCGDKPIALATLMTAAGIGIFGADAVLKYFIPAAFISLTVTIAYIIINIPRGDNAGGSFWALLRGFIGGLLSVPVSLVKTLGNLLNQKTGTLVKKKQTLPNAEIGRASCRERV